MMTESPHVVGHNQLDRPIMLDEGFVISTTTKLTKQNISNVLKTAKLYHPTANIYMCSIISKDDKYKEPNNFIATIMDKNNETYVNTTHVESIYIILSKGYCVIAVPPRLSFTRLYRYWGCQVINNTSE